MRYLLVIDAVLVDRTLIGVAVVDTMVLVVAVLVVVTVTGGILSRPAVTVRFSHSK